MFPYEYDLLNIKRHRQCVSLFITISLPVKRLNVYLHDLKDTYILLSMVIKFKILSNISDAACSTSSDHDVHGSLLVMAGPQAILFEPWSTAFHEFFPPHCLLPMQAVVLIFLECNLLFSKLLFLGLYKHESCCKCELMICCLCSF
jgi:hypothetical protein